MHEIKRGAARNATPCLSSVVARTRSIQQQFLGLGAFPERVSNVNPQFNYIRSHR